ncbi:MAG: hypothetical protein COB93_00885 [Sneathiella sp.]|nr:MAG: hypothetical protein COB93_00885 [Sneathiella sp.]
MAEGQKTVLWWGRFDPDYSRNRILRQAFTALGWRLIDFNPVLSAVANWQAILGGLAIPDLVWLPAFRQRDVRAAAKWARARKVPLIFDPLISAYDKQVYERQKFGPGSANAAKLLAWEKSLFAAADKVIADTAGHADFFAQTFDLPSSKIAVIPVSAEESLFTAAPPPENDTLEALFFGSFIGLQAPDVIVEAAKLCGAPVHWTLLGAGPEKSACEAMAAGQNAISFEEYLPYAQLPARIHKADILLGIFGTTDKAARVIPNKVYQSLACGRPVISRQSAAYPEQSDGLIQIPPGNPQALADAMAQLYTNRSELEKRGIAARQYYDQYFSTQKVKDSLSVLLDSLHR